MNRVAGTDMASGHAGMHLRTHSMPIASASAKVAAAVGWQSIAGDCRCCEHNEMIGGGLRSDMTEQWDDKGGAVLVLLCCSWVVTR